MRFYAEPCGSGWVGIYTDDDRLLAYHWDLTLAQALCDRLNRRD